MTKDIRVVDGIQMKKNDISIVKGSDNVFVDLGLPDAGDLQIKAELTRQIRQRIKALKLNQTQAAERLGLKQPDVSKLMRGRYTGFSLDRLIMLLSALDVDVDIVLHHPSGQPKKPLHRGIVRVMADAD